MKVDFTDNEKQMIKKIAEIYHLSVPLDFDFDDESAENLRDAAMDFEVIHGLDENYDPTADGELAIRIADKLLAA